MDELISKINQNTEDGYIIESEPIASGSLVSGTVYVVKEKQIVYNGVVYAVNSTFTASAAGGAGGSGYAFVTYWS